MECFGRVLRTDLSGDVRSAANRIEKNNRVAAYLVENRRSLRFFDDVFVCRAFDCSHHSSGKPSAVRN